MIPLSHTQSAIRFTIELVALVAWGAAAWQLPLPTPLDWFAVGGVIVVVAGVWAVFRVPGDASAHGDAPVAVDGATRLGMELVLLLGAVAALVDIASAWTGLVFAGAVAWHYVATRDRVRWLLDTTRGRGAESARRRHRTSEEVAR